MTAYSESEYFPKARQGDRIIVRGVINFYTNLF